jgi:hypothetical protein
MKRIAVIIMCIGIGNSHAQEKEKLQWQVNYGLGGNYFHSGSLTSSSLTNSFQLGIYRNITNRWWWNANLKYSYTGFQSRNFPANFNNGQELLLSSASLNGKYHSMGLSYKVGYKFIAKERFSVSTYLGLQLNSGIYSSMLTTYNNPAYGSISNRNGFTRPRFNYLYGIQAEYKLSDKSAVFFAWEADNMLRLNRATINLGSVQIGFRRTFGK